MIEECYINTVVSNGLLDFVFVFIVSNRKDSLKQKRSILFELSEKYNRLQVQFNPGVQIGPPRFQISASSLFPVLICSQHLWAGWCPKSPG